MAKQFYQKSNGDLVVWGDPQNLSEQAVLQERIDALTPFQALPDEARTLLAQGGVPGAGIPGGFSDLASFDTWLNDELERLQDVVDYYGYQVKQETLGNVCDGDWFAFEAVEAFSNETPLFEAGRAIDGENSTDWRPLTAPASITLRLRAYRKNVESIRLWIPNNTLMTELQGLTIRAAQNLGQIDEPRNVVASDLNLSYDGAAWQTVPFDFKKRCRYIKLDITGSNHVANAIAIRNIKARVVTFNHDK